MASVKLDDRLLYFFEIYALHTDRRELRRGEVLLQLEPKVFDLLLIAKRDRVVNKEDLIAGSGWGGSSRTRR